jgi:hypothetical protein
LFTFSPCIHWANATPCTYMFLIGKDVQYLWHLKRNKILRHHMYHRSEVPTHALIRPHDPSVPQSDTRPLNHAARAESLSF